MIQAELGLSREDLDAQRVALLRAQEARTTALLGPDIESKRAAARAAIANAKLHELQAELAQETRPLEIAKLKAEIERTQAAAAASGTGAELDRAKMADIGATRAQQERHHQETTIPFIFPDGSRARVTADRAMEAMARGGTVDQDKTFRQQRDMAHDVRQAGLDAEKVRADTQVAEESILGKDDKGNLNINNPAIVARVDHFNRTADKDYFYSYSPPVPGKPDWMGGGAKATRIPLRTKEGKPIQARAVYQAWEEYKRDVKDITLEDYVKLKLGGKK